MSQDQILRQKLRQELELGQASIARNKAYVMEGTKTSLRVMKLKQKRADELKDRKAAFAVFNRNVTRAQKLGAKLKVGRLIVYALHKQLFRSSVILNIDLLWLQKSCKFTKHEQKNRHDFCVVIGLRQRLSRWLNSFDCADIHLVFLVSFSQEE